jgi:hypothetical protein
MFTESPLSNESIRHSIIIAIKLRTVKLYGHFKMHEEVEMHTYFWSGNNTGRKNSVDIGIDGKVMLNLILGK